MSDIFLSCATDDAVTAKKLAAVFRREGWTVWWDASTITPGADYVEAVMEELKHSKVVIVLWSRAAYESRLVQEVVYRTKKPVVAVRLEKGVVPALFYFDLSDWDGSASRAGLQALLRHLHALLATLRPAKPQASLEELSLPEIRESARLGIKAGAEAQPEGGARFRGVFISYRRNEAVAYAGRLYDRLAAHFGKERVFLDMENIRRGADFVEAITEAAKSCAVMIALISRQWVRAAGGEQGEDDDFVRLEIKTALRRKIPVLPITIQGASMPRPKELPDDLAPLARINDIPLSDDARWGRDVKDLIETLEGLLKD